MSHHSETSGKRRSLKAREVRDMARGRWDSVYATLVPHDLREAMEKAPRHVPNPRKAGSRDGFRLAKDWLQEGAGYINSPDECGAGPYVRGSSGQFIPDGLAMLQWLRPDWSFGETLEAVFNAIGGDRENLPDVTRDPVMRQQEEKRNEERQRKQAKEDEEDRKSLNRLTEGSMELESDEGVIGRTYMENRGIRLQEWPETIRFHPRLGWWDKEIKQTSHFFPGLLTLVTQEDGTPATLHRTFLAEDGSGKAPVPPGEAKRMCRYPSTLDITGGAAPLFPCIPGEHDTLHIGEGLESILSVRFGLGESEPVWATLNTGLMRGFRPPEHVRRIIVWADLDRSVGGEHAAAVLARRLADRNVEVKVLFALPEVPEGMKSFDWNDALQAYGPDYIREARRYV